MEYKDLKLISAEELQNFLKSKNVNDYVLNCMSTIRGDDLDQALREEGLADLKELMSDLPKMTFRSFLRMFEDLKDENDCILTDTKLLQKSIVSELKTTGPEVPSIATLPNPDEVRYFANLTDKEFEAVLKAWGLSLIHI